MSSLVDYTEAIRARGNAALADSIEETAADAEKLFLRDFDYMSSQLGLLLGNVQSGKTAQMFGIISQAADDGFMAFLLLTTDNVALQQQTLTRVQRDLPGFCICGENDGRLFEQNALVKPCIIVLKKNARVLKLWANTLKATSFMLGNPLFVLDDEADAASLNTLVNQQKQSSINRYLSEIRAQASSCIYLQVTGTPQALLLQTKLSHWQPSFTYYFRPGKGYLGGDFFFPEGEPPAHIRLLEHQENTLGRAVWHHMLASAQILLTGGTVCNFVIHPSVRTSSHAKYARDVKACLAAAKAGIDAPDIADRLADIYAGMHPAKSALRPLAELIAEVRRLLQENAVRVLEMNGKHEVEAAEYAAGSNIIIGGNTLGRGVTFGGLQTVYYTRTAKKPQADTMWQHSRMFGYDRDPGLMELYIQDHLYRLFQQINAVNNSLIAQIERGVKDIRLYYSEKLNPTRSDVQDKEHIFILAGGVGYFPRETDNDDIEALDKLLDPFDGKAESYQTSMRLIQRLLKHIMAEADFHLPAFQSYMQAVMAEHPGEQARLIVRRERDISRRMHALLSSDDQQISKSFPEQLVLVMYKMKGTKGWEGRKVWVPDIRLPEKIVYYDIEEDDE